MFNEIAHSYRRSRAFYNTCTDRTTASEVEDWIEDYDKMPFTFLASCKAMCDSGANTLHHQFRKGSTQDTAVVGYCDMHEPICQKSFTNWIPAPS
jgi:hypothetical protein